MCNQFTSQSRDFSKTECPISDFCRFPDKEQLCSGQGGCRYFFDGTYGDFLKNSDFTTHPPLFKKFPFTFQILLKTPHLDASIKMKQHYQTVSDCMYYVKLYKPKKSTTYAPSTNSIMICTVCHQQHWKYNMAVHYSLNHLGHNLPEDCQIECTEEDRVKKLKF